LQNEIKEIYKMAEVKNFGLAGIGADVQYGKGGGHFAWDGTAFNVLGSDGSTPVTLKGAVGVAEDDFVTVAQLQSAAQGIKVKPAVITATNGTITGVTTGNNEACAWTGSTSFAAATPTAAEVGQFTNAPRTIAGVTLEQDDRVLVRYEGITNPDTNPVVSSGAQSNGIYKVTAVTGVLSITAPTIGNAGTGYAVNDVLTLTGGTFTTAATVQVDSVDTGGEILTISLLNGGAYTVLPSSPAATTNSGSGDDAATIGFTGASTNDTVTLVRTADSGGDLTAGADAAAAYLRNNNSFVYGDYTFVTDGDNGGNAYLLSNYLNVSAPGDPLEPDLNVDSANGYAIYLTFTQAPVYLADDGVELSGQTFRMDIDSLTTGTTNTTDTVISFSDGSGAPNFKSTLHNVFIDNNVPHDLPDFTSAGVLTRTANDDYNTTPIAASTVAGDQGISIVAGYATSIDIGLDITGLNTSAITTAAEIVTYDGTNNIKRTMANVFADLDVVTTPSITTGLLTKTANDTYVGRNIAVVADGSTNGGLSVVNGTGVAGNPTLGLDIINTTVATGGVALADSFLVYDASDTVNRRATIQGIIDLVAGNISDNEISQGDSSVVVTDAGTGSVVTTVDGTTIVTVTAADGLVATELAGQNLTATEVLFAGTGGAILSDAGMTYDSVNNDLTVTGDGNFGSLTTTVGAIVSATNISAGGNITTATGNITATAGTVTGSTVTGTTLLSTGATGSLTVGTAGATINDLTVAGGIVYTAANKLTQEAAFYYDSGTNTLHVDNIVTTSGGVGTIAENEIAFGDANGNVIGNSAFVVDATNKTIDIGTLNIDGDTGTQGLYGNEVDGNINIVPDGTGEVVIGAAGDGTIASDTGSALTVDGDTSLTLTSTAGTVTIQNGTTDVAEFVANASADTGLVFSSDSAANAPSIASSGTSDIKFILGTNNLLIVNDAAAYQAELEAGTNADALVTKGYVDDAIQSGAAAESIKSILATVPLNADATVNIGDVLPTGAIVLRTKLNVTTLNAGTTVSVGVTGGLSSYMATTENDPQTPGLYLAESFVTNSGQQVVATVANSGNTGSGSATVLVEYRVPA
jgi:hypothetical protein